VLLALDTLGHESRASGNIVSGLVILDGSGESGISGGQHLEDERGTWEGGCLELGLGLGISEEERDIRCDQQRRIGRNKGTYSSAEHTWRLNLVSPEPSLGEKYACTEVATQGQLGRQGKEITFAIRMSAELTCHQCSCVIDGKLKASLSLSWMFSY
jgi:hypothetical protein